MADFESLMNGFGVVTVMNACIYKLNSNSSYVGRGACDHAGTSGGALTPSNFECTGLYLDTLKIANLTQEGPTKTVTGGQYASPLIKYGKTMTCEMQDALGRAATLVEFFGCDYDETTGRLSVTDKFPGAFAIEGDTFFINQKTGEKEDVHIFIPQFLPDAILTLTQDAEGDAAVFDLNGSVNVTKVADSADAQARDIFYEVRKEKFFKNVPVTKDPEHNWHVKGGASEVFAYFYVGNDLYAKVTEVEGTITAPVAGEINTINGYTVTGWGTLSNGVISSTSSFEKGKDYYAILEKKA